MYATPSKLWQSIPMYSNFMQRKRSIWKWTPMYYNWMQTNRPIWINHIFWSHEAKSLSFFIGEHLKLGSTPIVIRHGASLIDMVQCFWVAWISYMDIAHGFLGLSFRNLVRIFCKTSCELFDMNYSKLEVLICKLGNYFLDHLIFLSIFLPKIKIKIAII